jgi:hypothetical protein
LLFSLPLDQNYLAIYRSHSQPVVAKIGDNAHAVRVDHSLDLTDSSGRPHLSASNLIYHCRYRSPRGTDSDAAPDTTIPAGRPYLTKVNGSLAMARHKNTKVTRAIASKSPREIIKTMNLTRPAEATIDFLGEAFGVRSRGAHIRAKSMDTQVPASLMTSGLPYPSQPYLTYSTPLPQRSFSTMSSFPPMPVFEQPILYSVTPPQPTNSDFDQLGRIDAHYRSINDETTRRKEPTTVQDNCKDKGSDSKTEISIIKHTCANCGRLRSKRYYSEHPIKPGETPVQEFCRKCQRDASYTSSSSTSDDVRGGKHSKKKKNVKARKNKEVCVFIPVFLGFSF